MPQLTGQGFSINLNAPRILGVQGIQSGQGTVERGVE
jgi:hypothetical protein